MVRRINRAAAKIKWILEAHFHFTALLNTSGLRLTVAQANAVIENPRTPCILLTKAMFRITMPKINSLVRYVAIATTTNLCTGKGLTPAMRPKRPETKNPRRER